MGHTYSNLLYHVTFGTKDRSRTIQEAWARRLHQYMAGVARKEFGKAIAIGGTDDHVHGLLVLPTTACIAEAMRKWKSLSSKWVNETLSQARRFAWQSSAPFRLAERVRRLHGKPFERVEGSHVY